MSNHDQNGASAVAAGALVDAALATSLTNESIDGEELVVHGNGYGMNGGGSWVFGLFLLVGLGLLLLLAVRSFGASRSSGDVIAPTTGKGPERSTARGILDERLARGELSPTEYRDRLETLHEAH
jgi:putative membrane protein